MIPATGHQHTEIKNAKEPTCEDDGYTGDTVCKDCGDTVETGTAIPKLGHDYSGEWVTIKEPTTTEEGEKAQRCTHCGELDPSHTTIPKLPSEEDNGADEGIIRTHLQVLTEDHRDIIRDQSLVTLTQVSRVLYIDAAEDIATLHGTLEDLSDLMNGGIDTIVFTTHHRVSTLRLGELVLLGADDTVFDLAHIDDSATLTVGGVEHNALIH